MKLFGNSSKKKSTGVKSVPVEEKSKVSKTESVESTGKGGLIGALARPGIRKAKAAIDPEVHKTRTPEERKRIEEEVERYQRRKVTTRLVTIIIIVLLIAAAVVFYKMTVVPPDVNPSPTPDGPAVTPSATVDPGVEPSPTPSRTPLENVRQEGMYTFLVVGNDNGYGNTDTLIVGRLDTKNHKLNLVSIPRDTMVNVEWPVKKVNTIQAFSDNGIDGLMDGISNIVGFDIDSYISVNLKGFRALVQAIGGVYFDVPQDMKYGDPTQNLVIDIKEGYQLLTPEQAEGVVRFRSGYVAGDIKRIEVQQDFLMALAKQCLSMKNLTTNIDEYAEIFKTYVTTDLSLGNIVWYGQEMLKLSPSDISFATLPANYNDSVRGLSYCTIYLDRWVAMINSTLNPYVAPVKAENLDVITRDEDGNLYATAGAIAGGYESFYDNTTPIVPDDDDEEETTEPETGDTPAEPSTEPSPEPSTEPSPEPSTRPSPEPSTEPSPEPSTEPSPEPSTEPEPEETESPWDDIEDDEPETTPEPSEEPEEEDPEKEEDTGSSGGLGGGSPTDIW
ncbi:MAG: LCP family protein [Oscillospiraceae bacterium]|nr:LCP family protein [Oscillospiraceae bacterium]